MSLFSRLFGKTAPKPAAVAPPTPAQAPSPRSARPDPAVTALAELVGTGFGEGVEP